MKKQFKVEATKNGLVFYRSYLSADNSETAIYLAKTYHAPKMPRGVVWNAY